MIPGVTLPLSSKCLNWEVKGALARQGHWPSLRAVILRMAVGGWFGAVRAVARSDPHSHGKITKMCSGPKLHLAFPEPEGSIMYYLSRKCRESLLEKLPRNHSLGSLLAFPRSEEGTSEISGTLSRDWVHITETGTTWVTSTVGTSPRGGYLSDPSSETRQQWKISKTLLHSFTRRLLNPG